MNNWSAIVDKWPYTRIMVWWWGLLVPHLEYLIFFNSETTPICSSTKHPDAVLILLQLFRPWTVVNWRKITTWTPVVVAIIGNNYVITIGAKPRAIWVMASNQIVFACWDKFLFHVKWENESSFFRIIDRSWIARQPGVVSVATNGLSKFSSDQDQSIVLVIAPLVERWHLKVMFWSSVKFLDFDRISKDRHFQVIWRRKAAGNTQQSQQQQFEKLSIKK